MKKVQAFFQGCCPPSYPDSRMVFGNLRFLKLTILMVCYIAAPCHSRGQSGSQGSGHDPDTEKPLKVKIISPSYVFVGETFVIKAAATDGQEPYTYEWEFGDSTPNFSTKELERITYKTPYEREVVVKVRDSLERKASASVKINVFEASFSGPDKIGVWQQNGAAKEQTYTITVSDPSLAQDVSLESTRSDKATIVADSRRISGNSVTYRVRGVAGSEMNEVALVAKIKGREKIKNITIVVPTKLVHQGWSGKEPEEVAYSTEYSASPVLIAAEDKATGIWCVANHRVKHDLKIKVLDQFGNPLGNIYNGAKVEESLDHQGFRPINQRLAADEYVDPVAVGEVPTVPLAGTPGAPILPYPTEAWIRANKPPNKAGAALPPNAKSPLIPADAAVRIDGFELPNEISGRTAQIVDGVFVIKWP